MSRVLLLLLLLLPVLPVQLMAQPKADGVAGLVPLPASGTDPWFAGNTLFGDPQDRLWGLAKTEHPGLVAFDPGSGALFASAAGVLVEVKRDGSLLVLDPELDARDLDVRKLAGLVAWRGPGGVMLRHLGQPERDLTLRAGEDLFEPRFDRDGNRLLVSESGAQGGRFHVLLLADGSALASVQGGGPAWAGPDAVVFHRTVHDGHSVTGSELWLLDLTTGTQTQLTHSPRVAETQPAASPDGRWWVFVDALTGQLRTLPRAGKEAAHEGL